ncbi:hypothetical protein SLA2020_120710 [Shorea laevis]
MATACKHSDSISTFLQRNSLPFCSAKSSAMVSAWRIDFLKLHVFCTDPQTPALAIPKNDSQLDYILVL